MATKTTAELRAARHARLRKNLSGTTERPRLAVFRSLKHIYAQIVDDTKGHTLVAASSMEKEISSGGNKDGAKTVGAKLAVGRERPVVLHLGDGALTYSAAGFWSMARYNTAVLTVVSNNESYQIVRHNWAREMPDTKMIREGKYPGLFLGAPATDYVGLARSQGVDG